MAEEQRTFTMRQMISLLGAVTVMSGGGAALTVSASDAVQDAKIENLEDHLARVVDETKETTKAVVEVSAKVEAVGARVDDIKGDIGELRGLIIRSLQRNASR